MPLNKNALTPIPKKVSTFNTNSYTCFYILRWMSIVQTPQPWRPSRYNDRFHHTIGAAAFWSIGISYINVTRKIHLRPDNLHITCGTCLLDTKNNISDHRHVCIRFSTADCGVRNKIQTTWSITYQNLAYII
jgi:hypothetical protein